MTAANNNMVEIANNKPSITSFSARCPVCSEEFDERKGLDVDRGEVCCTEECATDFKYDPDLYT